jgi:hypothetical protein
VEVTLLCPLQQHLQDCLLTQLVTSPVVDLQFFFIVDRNLGPTQLNWSSLVLFFRLFPIMFI